MGTGVLLPEVAEDLDSVSETGVVDRGIRGAPPPPPPRADRSNIRLGALWGEAGDGRLEYSWPWRLAPEWRNIVTVGVEV